MPRLYEVTADEVDALPAAQHPRAWPVHGSDTYCETCGAYGNVHVALPSGAYPVSGYICNPCLNTPRPCGSCGRNFYQFAHPMPYYSVSRYGGYGLCRECGTHTQFCPCGRYAAEDGWCIDCRPTSTAPTRPCPRCARGTIHLNRCNRCRQPAPEGETETKRIRFARPLGLELEFVSLQIEATDRVAQWGLLHNDGSVGRVGKHYLTKDRKPPNLEHRDFHPYELSMRPESGDRAAGMILEATSFLVDNYDAYTNETCGTHTHVYVGDLSEKERWNVAQWWRVHEYMFTRVLPQWRENNSYAKRVGGIEDAGWQRDRYRALNLTAYPEHGTYEFRLHHGTLNGPALVNWSNLLLFFIEAYRGLDQTRDGALALARGGKRKLFALFCRDTSLPLHLRKWILGNAKIHWTRRCGLFRGGIEEPAPAAAPVPTVDPVFIRLTDAYRVAMDYPLRRR